MIDSIWNWMSAQNPELIKAWGPVAIGLLTVLVSFGIGFITVCIAMLTIRNQRLQNRYQNEANIRQFHLAKFEEERNEITKKLNGFYGPLKELRTQSKIFYSKFASALRSQYRETTKQRFRTLRYLLEGNKFTDQDDQILSEILRNGRKQLKLIETQSGVVDKPELQDLLGKLCAHIRLLQLAYDGKLSGPAEKFEDIVFPLPIDGAIESAILRLQDRMIELSEIGGSYAHARPCQTTENSTIAFYNKNAAAYANKTLSLDLRPTYTKFRELVPSGRLLDAGCGAGRDTRFFIEKGYIVIAFDASLEMVRKCREYPHAYCIRRDLTEISFTEEFDGIWACASLLHLRFDRAKSAIAKLATALKPGGVMYVSVKSGAGEARESGRYFQYYDDSTIRGLFADDSRLSILSIWHSIATGPDGDQETDWINVFVARNLDLFRQPFAPSITGGLTSTGAASGSKECDE